MGIKLGILGLPRADYDLLLLPQAAEEDQALGDETSEVSDESEVRYLTRMICVMSLLFKVTCHFRVTFHNNYTMI